MKRIVVISILLGLQIINAYSQDSLVSIPDIAFLHVLIEEGVDTDGDSLISYKEAEAVTTLRIWWKKISDMAGIESFINLDTLDCFFNGLVSLDISSIKDLIYLQCSSNHITDLDISENIKLEYLSCGGNPLHTLDISNNVKLKYLDCSGNPLHTLDVSNNPELKSLNCRANQLTSLDISNCPLLEGLWCGTNQLNSLDVSANPVLKILECGSNAIRTLDVSHNIFLEFLYCRNCFWMSSLNISENVALISLYISQNQDLKEVCVWEGFNSEALDIDTTASPKICFQIDCNGNCSIVGMDKTDNRGFSIYPNPTNTLLTIETGISDQYNVEITSLNGQLLFKGEMEGATLQSDLSSFQKGVYFITIRSKDFVAMRKIIKL